MHTTLSTVMISKSWMTSRPKLSKNMVSHIIISTLILIFGLSTVQAASVIPPAGSLISLTAVNGKYVSADNTGNTLIANQTDVGDYETFEIVDAGGGKVGLKCLGNGKFVCAESSGNAALAANRSSMGSWEKFTIVESNGQIGLIASINGMYVCAETNGSDPLIANRTRMGSYEKFYCDIESDTGNPLFYSGDVIALKAVNGSYVTASSSGNVLIATKDKVGSYESFEVVDAGNGFIGLKCLGNGNFVCAEGTGAQPLEATRSKVGSWEKFAIEDLGSHKIGIEAAINNLYVCAQDGGSSPLLACRTSIKSWETFTWEFADQGPIDPGDGQDTVLASDVKFVLPDASGPEISPIFGYNWTSGRIKSFREEGENWYEWPIYDHSADNKIMDRNEPEYWDVFVDELLLARVHVISFHHRGPKIGDMHVQHVKKFIEAAERAGVRDQFKISYFEDTGMHGDNVKYSSNGATGTQLNCSDRTHQEYLYLDYYKEFFKTIPKDMWYTYNNRPVISAWNAMSDFKNRQDLSVMLNYCANRFQQDFGVKPLWVLQDNWFKYDPRLNNTSLVLGKHSWFSKARDINATYATFDAFKTGVISPGYKNEVSKIEGGNTYEMKRWINGKNMARQAFEQGTDADLILLEGWTNLVESSGWYRSDQWTQPTEYINLVRHYADPAPKSLRFEAEGADAFYDTTPKQNTFGDYSKRGLDVKRFETTNSNGVLTESDWYVDDVKSGEWLEYQNVEVGKGTYRFTARVATNGAGKELELVLPGTSIIKLPDTNGKFVLVHLGEVYLYQGKHDFRLKFYSSGIKVDWFFMKKK